MMVDPDEHYDRTDWRVAALAGATSRATTRAAGGRSWSIVRRRRSHACGRAALPPEHRITFILWEQPHGRLALQKEDVPIRAASTEGRAQYKARDFASRHRLGLQLAMNFFETWHDRGDGQFDARPWWHVRDTESLAQVGHLIPHKERGRGGRGKPTEAAKDEL